MGDRNRSRYGRRQRGGPWRPPLPPPDHGHKHCPVPLWEREFCSYVGNISWQRFCENKKYVSIYNNFEHWDDSGAFENFQNAKARFWADYHGQPSDIPLPDPDMYIDEVDHHCTVDPELAADVEKVLLPIDSDYDYSSIPVMGWVNTWEYNNFTMNQSAGNCTEKPAEVHDWGWEPSHGSNATWGGNNESSSKWDNNNSGWCAEPEKPSWGSLSNNQYASNNRYSNFYGGSNNNWYFNQRNNKQKDHHEGFQRSSLQDPSRGKKMEWRPVAKKASQQDGQGIEGGS
ncbi:hypothetical protein SEVIR_8G200100v4 [Setaria viridis]|nr:uncharacterized protein LOC117866363 [Setaria viridis]